MKTMKKVLYILGMLNDDDIEWLVSNGRRQVIPEGGVLIREGEAVETIYVTLDGELAVRSSVAGDELNHLGPGEIVGEMSFVDALPPSATVTAVQETVVLSVPRPDLTDKLERDPPFAARFYRAIATFLSARLRGTMDHMGGLGAQALDEDRIEEDELDPNVLDGVYLAGLRFERILKRMMNT
jgi:CRP/FNR family cyclic AMP-dependent transcriptional regulator